MTILILLLIAGIIGFFVWVFTAPGEGAKHKTGFVSAGEMTQTEREEHEEHFRRSDALTRKAEGQKRRFLDKRGIAYPAGSGYGALKDITSVFRFLEFVWITIHGEEPMPVGFANKVVRLILSDKKLSYKILNYDGFWNRKYMEYRKGTGGYASVLAMVRANLR